MVLSPLTRSGVIRAKEGREEVPGGSLQKVKSSARRLLPPPGSLDGSAALPVGAPGCPVLQKLAGLHREAQLTLASARASDPPKGILTSRLFSSELPGAFGFITGN